MKVPEPKKLPSGTWFIQMRLNGVSVPVSAPSKKECIQQAQLIKAEHIAGKRRITKKTEQTISELMQAYIDSIRATASPATVRGYASIKKTRFLSISDSTHDSIKDWQKVIDTEANLVSAKTLKNAWGFLASALRYANLPVPEIRLPQVIRAEKQWLEPDDILKFVKILKGDRFEIPALLALHGLRRSEILAMTYEMVDIKEKTITVHGSSVLDEDGELIKKSENKNTSSRRVVPIMIPELIDAINAVPAEKRTGLIYTANPTTLYWRVNQICENNALPKVGVHGLRHSFASLAYHVGMSEQDTMELGGWSDYNTMRKIYTHLAQCDRLKARNKMAAFFENTRPEEENANENANK